MFMTNHQTMKHDAVCSAHGFFVLIFIPAGSEPSDSLQGYAILVCEEFSCLEFHMNRDMTNWILIKIEYRRSENGTITKTDTRKWH